MLVKGRGIDEILRPFELFIDIFEYLLGMYLGLDLLGSENLFNLSLLIEQPCSAQGAHTFASAHCLLAPCTKLLEEGGVGVGYQREGKRIFLNEFLMGCS